MELIDAYVSEVGRRLPEKSRADIEREIRSMIEDTLEDESAAQGRPVDEDMLVTVLTRIGSPERLADSYAPPKYLVGPALYPSYVLSLKVVLGIVLAVGALVAAISTAAGVGLGHQTALQGLAGLAKGVGGLFNAGLQVVGTVTIIFALIQRSAPDLKPAEVQAPFDPRRLKTVQTPVPNGAAEPFKPAGLVVEIVLAAFALLIFNFYPQAVGIYSFDGSSWTVTPFLTKEFFGYVPFLSILWALELVLKSSVLGIGGWSLLTKWMRVGLDVLTVGMLYALLTGPAIISVPAAAIINPGSVEFPGNLNMVINQGLRLGMGIAMVVTCIELVVTAVKLGFATVRSNTAR